VGTVLACINTASPQGD